MVHIYRIWEAICGNAARKFGNQLTDLPGSASDQARDWSKWLSKRKDKAAAQTSSWLGYKKADEGFAQGHICPRPSGAVWWVRVSCTSSTRIAAKNAVMW